jgi:hypothetical protein
LIGINFTIIYFPVQTAAVKKKADIPGGNLKKDCPIKRAVLLQKKV